MPDSEVDLLRSYVSRAKALQVATADPQGNPWVVTCWYAPDEKLNPVFISKLDREHSRHILSRPSVAISILDIELEGLGQKVVGVQGAGLASVVSGASFGACYETYRRRFPQVVDLIPASVLEDPDSGVRLWQIEMKRFVYFDEINFPDDPRRDVSRW